MSEVKFKDRRYTIFTDPPVALPVDFKRPLSIDERIRQLTHGDNIRQLAEEAVIDTFEDADDFDVPDDISVDSPWEDGFDPMQPGAMAREAELRGGIVNDRTPEQKAQARSLWNSFLDWKKNRQKPKGEEPPAAAPVPKS